MVQPSYYSSVCIDANLLIRYFTNDVGGDQIDWIMRKADAGELELFISTILIVEALGQKPGNSVDLDLEAKVMTYLDHPAINVVEVDVAVASAARSLRLHDTRLKTWDAIHVATAVHVDADVFFTFDDKIGLNRSIDNVWLSRPYVSTSINGEGDLFADNSSN